MEKVTLTVGRNRANRQFMPITGDIVTNNGYAPSPHYLDRLTMTLRARQRLAEGRAKQGDSLLREMDHPLFEVVHIDTLRKSDIYNPAIIAISLRPLSDSEMHTQVADLV